MSGHRLKSFPNWARDATCDPKKLKDAQRKKTGKVHSAGASGNS